MLRVLQADLFWPYDEGGEFAVRNGLLLRLVCRRRFEVEGLLGLASCGRITKDAAAIDAPEEDG